jgi:general secretion pathway protein K
MVLIMVLAVVAMFTAMIISFKSDQAIETELAYNFRDSLQSQYLGSAGVEAAISVLAKNDNEYDDTEEEWGKFSEYMIVASTRLEGMTIQGNITDECSKLDLNALVKFDPAGNKFKHDEQRIQQLKKLMIDVLDVGITESEFDDLALNLCDWLDTDTDPDPRGGAEDEYYRTLDNPYDCKDGYMDTPEEILLVKGMKKEWYYGEGTKEGIEKYVTVGTKGVVNLNTASEEVLESLSPNVDKKMVDTIINMRPIKNTSDLQKCEREFDGLKGYEYDDKTTEFDFLTKGAVSIKSSLFSVDIKGMMPSGALLNTKAKLLVDEGAPTIVYYKVY